MEQMLRLLLYHGNSKLEPAEELILEILTGRWIFLRCGEKMRIDINFEAKPIKEIGMDQVVTATTPPSKLWRSMDLKLLWSKLRN